MSLYNIVAEYGEKIAALDFAQTEEEVNAILAELDGLDDDLLDKAEQYARVIRNLEASVSGYETEIKRLQKSKKTYENAVMRMKEMLHTAMEVSGQRNIQTSIGKWSIRKNPASVNVLDEKSIPPQYWIPQDPKLDKATILVELKAGAVIPGAQLQNKEGIRLS